MTKPCFAESSAFAAARRSGVSVAQANTEMTGIAARLAQQYPNNNTDLSAGVYPLLADTVQPYRIALILLMCATGFVLLIACANVANLLLARASERSREMAIRAALGAGRIALLLQSFSFSLLSVFAGIALLLAAFGIYGVMSYNVSQRMHEIGIGVAIGLTGSMALVHFASSLLVGTGITDWVTLTGVAFILALVAFVACWIPARRATKVDPIILMSEE